MAVCGSAVQHEEAARVLGPRWQGRRGPCKGWHYFPCQDLHLFFEGVQRHTLGPLKQNVFQTGVFSLDLFELCHKVVWWTA